MATDQYGRIIRRARPNLPDTHYTPTYTSTSSNWWEGLNNGVANFGNWLNENAENATTAIMGIAGIGAIVGLIIWVLGVFSSDGFIFGVLSIFGACFIGYIAFAIIGIASYILGLILLGVRYIFWNIYTLLIAIAIVVLLIAANAETSHSRSHQTPTTNQYVASQTTTYYCTARSALNIRSAPNTNSRVIGTIRPNQTVEVFSITNGFAKIKYGTENAYVSSQYLRKR
ncbi:SH3 domain-containing protein [uncultured Bacteroides sp.]|jgi:hypothetical protein|uniref:SH3 domain-containing protein n=1 Tax=Bacteroides congonensis TaxID=1871006 RepID=UPI00258ECE65|nr:SH3 domain-containing protein [uncultured Bacteroides sp.]